MQNKGYIFIVLFLVSSVLYSQDNWMFKGYVKGMTAMQTVGEDGEMAIENTVHNRFDVNWYINENFTVSVGLRNRIIAGNNVSLIPNYSNYLGRDVGYIDLSWVWADENSWIGISQIDRLAIDYVAGNLQVTIGRQRINWGQTFVWNPNDLFNTYSYFDFDYEEKPGSDAIRLQYYIGEASKLELSTALNNDEKVTSAFLYRFNTHGYDIQFIGGVFTESDYAIGSGWSGNIGGGGFSGEITYFHPMENNSETSSEITATIHFDYTFKNSLSLQFESLYNGFGMDDFSSGLGEILFMDLSSKNLFPTKTALFGSGSYNLSPLLTVMLAGMYGPEGNFIYIGPTITYSISDNMELASFGQYYTMDEVEESLANTGTAIFIRLKWAF